MAITVQVKNSFGQDFTVKVPVNEGQPFRGVPGNSENTAFVYKGGVLYQIPKNQYAGNFESLPRINPSSEAFDLLSRFGQLRNEVVSSEDFQFNTRQEKPKSIFIGNDQNNPSKQQTVSSTRGELIQVPRQNVVGQAPPASTVTAPIGSSERTRQLLEAASRFTGIPSQTQAQVSPGDKLQGEFKVIFEGLKGIIENLKQRGQVINPDIQITPERVAEFMKSAESNIGQFLPFAEKEITPFYQNQLKLARNEFLKGLGYTQDELLRTEADLERKYGKALQETGETAAERGFALSGIRQRQERELADATQQEIETRRRRFGQVAEKGAAEFAQKFGTAQIPAFTAPTAPRVMAGEGKFERNLTEQPVYQLSPEVFAGLTGEEEFKQRSALRSRAAELEEAFRTNEAIRQQRQISL